jgi:EpsI family protein
MRIRHRDERKELTNRPFIISLAVFCLSIAATFAVESRGTPVVVKTNLENLPMRIEGYHATEDSFSEGVYRELNADKHVYRHYRSPDGKEIDLYIGYYGTAKGGRTGHNPNACFSGAGWALVDSTKVSLGRPRDPEVNRLVTYKSGTYEVVLHWYQCAGKVVSTGWRQNIYRFLGLLFHNRNDGAFVRVSVATDRQHLGQATDTAKAFAERVVALLPQYWPEER